MPLTVAIMQPCFIPYVGYFRLFAASDLFVICDCVQFPRRDGVHRNRLLDGALPAAGLDARGRERPFDPSRGPFSRTHDATAAERGREFVLAIWPRSGILQLGGNDPCAGY